MLKRILQHFQQPARRNNNSQLAGSRLKVESLEARIVLTGTAGTVSMQGTVLSICGTGAGEEILIAELQNNYFVAADFLSQPLFFPKASVSQVVIDAGAGNDTIVARSMTTPVTLNGEAGNDRIFGGESHDIIYGGTGNDLIYGNEGVDTIRAGDGVDRVFGGTGGDVIHGGSGNDTLYGMAGNDAIHGNDGVDNLYGGADNDFLFGGADDDLLLGMHGADLLRGGMGNDRLFGDNNNNAFDDVMFGGGGNDQMFGGGGDDTLIGNEGNDLMRGGLGDDVLTGGSGQDNMFGLLGRDILIGGDGADQLEGNQGEDLIIGGVTDHQLNPSRLAATRQTWTSLHDTGTAYPAILSAAFSGYTITDPLDGDTIRGWAEIDAFHSEDASVILDLETGEGLVGVDALIINDSYTFIAGQANSINAANGVLANDLGAITAATIVTPPATGTLVLNPDGSFNYTNNTEGTDSFTYSVTSTGNLIATQATVNIVVNEIVAVDDSFDVAIDETLTTTAANGVLANDNLLGVAGVQATLVTNAAHGVLLFNPDGSFTFAMDEHGRDSFTYSITNPLSGQTRQATVELVVPGLPQLPAGASLTPLASGTGVQIFDFEVGTGASPTATSTVNVDYVGYLPNGTVFDSNDAIDFDFTTPFIDGFVEGTVGMQEGGMRRIVIPPDQGYGVNGNPQAGIGGTDTIIFDVTLNSVM